jgi:hypothetical protein
MLHAVQLVIWRRRLALSEQGRQNASAKNLCLGLQPVIERLAVNSAALFVDLVGPELNLPVDELVQEGLEFRLPLISTRLAIVGNST